MTRTEIRRFKRVLEDLKTELVHAVQNSLDRLVISQSADPMDQMRNLTDQEVDSRNISVLTTRLRSLESALRAIREGRFGRCISCDSEIPKKRLEAIPGRRNVSGARKLLKLRSWTMTTWTRALPAATRLRVNWLQFSPAQRMQKAVT